MPNNYSVKYVFEAIDSMSKQVGKMNRAMKGFKNTAVRVQQSVSRSMMKVGKSFNKAGNQMIKFGKKMSLFVSAPIIALGGFLIKAASDAEEASSKFNTVFKSIQTDANNVAKNLAKNYGMSRVASKMLLGDTGDLLTGFGFAQKTALDLSEQVNKLAVDLASFTNFSGGAEGASRALTKALLGERESIKTLGISILESDVKRRVQLLLAKGMRFETLRQAKAFATLQLAQEQSKNAIGDFARTQGGFANQLRIAKARVNDLAVEFGNVLLPSATKILKRFNEIVLVFEKVSPETKRMILLIGGIVAVVPPLLVGLGLLTKATGLLAIGFAALTGASLPFTLIGTAIALIVIHFEDLKKIVDEVWTSLVRFSSDMFKKIGLGGFAKQLFGFEVQQLETISRVDDAGMSEIDPVKQDLSFLKSKSDINMNIFAPKGVVQSTNMSTESKGVNLGLNMFETGKI